MGDIPKLIRGGKVAVLVSPDFGAGWSTWDESNAEAKLFDPEVAEAILGDDHDLAKSIAERKWPGGYNGGIRGLVVMWIEQGTAFRITEYDGSESLEEYDPGHYSRA